MNQPSLGHGEMTATLGRAIPSPGDTFNVVLTVGQPLAPNTLTKQNWLNKTTVSPQNHHVVKIAKDVNNYTTMQGFTPISSVEWYTTDFQPSEEPTPIPGRIKYGRVGHKIPTDREVDILCSSIRAHLQIFNSSTSPITSIEITQVVIDLKAGSNFNQKYAS